MSYHNGSRLTLFTCPKPFLGHEGVIQRNAIKSWTLLVPRTEILLFTDDAGTAEAALELNVRHVPEVKVNDYGTPLVNDLFSKAEQLAQHDLLCYVNADIILISGFVKAIEEVAARNKRFLVVGQRWDLDISEPLAFGPGWEDDLKSSLSQKGRLHSQDGLDYFAFPRGLWGKIPPFAIGRAMWDNWLLYKARVRGAVLVNATPGVLIAHQNHGYAHIRGFERAMWTSPEIEVNRELAGGDRFIFTLRDATHTLTWKGTRWVSPFRNLKRRLTYVMPALHPSLRPLVGGGLSIYRLVRRALFPQRVD